MVVLHTIDVAKVSAVELSPEIPEDDKLFTDIERSEYVL